MVKARDIDKGYAFAILPGCTVMYMLVIGGAKSYGLLFTELLNYFDDTASNTGWSTSLNICIITAMGPLANSLAKRFSFRKVTFIGGFVAGTGYILASIVPSMGYIYLTFGVTSGIGLGLVLSPSSTLVSFFFLKHRFIANGVVFASSGLWAAVLSFLYDYFIKSYGLRGTLLLCGGINFNICAAACIFVQPEELSQHVDNTSHEVSGSSQTQGGNWVNMKAWIADEMKIYITLLKQPSFLLFVISLMLYMYCYGAALVLMAAEVDHRGLSKINESINIAIFGVCDVVARLFFGWFSDKKLLHTRYIYILNLLMASTFMFLTPFVKSLAFLRVFSGSVGLFVSSYMALLVPYIIESFGMETFPQALGLSYMSMSVLMLISHPTIGMIADKTGNWDTGFIICGIIMVVAALLLSSEPIILRLRSKKKEHETEDGPTVWNTRL